MTMTQKNNYAEFVAHTLTPVFDKASRVLILGTMPSPKSREIGFYYSHPQNRFWKVLAAIFSQDIPTTNQEKEAFLYRNNIALWDVLRCCTIQNADDSTIANPVVNDFTTIFQTADIRAVFTTGKKAAALYEKHCMNEENRVPHISLPSTSPANCRLSVVELVKAYRIILDVLDRQ